MLMRFIIDSCRCLTKFHARRMLENFGRNESVGKARNSITTTLVGIVLQRRNDTRVAFCKKDDKADSDSATFATNKNRLSFTLTTADD